MTCSASYPETQWTLHAIATMNGDAAAARALEDLCRRYRGPVLALFRSKGLSHEDAEDLTQILLAQLTHTRTWQRADRDKGRFRDFLRRIGLNAYFNFCRYLKAGIRVPIPESLDLLMENGAAPPACSGDTCRSFDREWAWAALRSAIAKAEEKYADGKPQKAAHLPVLRRFLPGSQDIPSYAEAAAMIGVEEQSFGTVLKRFRADFVAALKVEIGLTLGPGDDLKEEMDYLRSVLEGPGVEENSPGTQNS